MTARVARPPLPLLLVLDLLPAGPSLLAADGRRPSAAYRTGSEHRPRATTRTLEGAGGFEAVDIAVDQLDRFEDAAGRFALPHLAEPAAAERLQQAIARNRFRFGFA